MKICRIVITYSPYPLGGLDIYAEEIHRELSKRIESSVVITINPTKGDRIEEQNGIKIYRIHPFNISTLHNIGRKSILSQGLWTLLDLYSLYSYKKIRDILKREKPDLVHMHTPIDVTLSAVSAVKSVGLPLVYTLHDYFLLCRRFTLLHGTGKICTDNDINPLCNIYRAFTRKIINDNVDVVIAPSQFVLDMHRKHGFFKNTKSIVLPHGIKLDNLQQTNIPKDKIKNLKILYVGALTKHKGLHILIKAVRQIKSKRLNVDVVGRGVYEHDLKSLVSDDSRIVFHGQLQNQEVQRFYQQADILVVPSIWPDVRPNVIVEALRAGTPVIASNTGGIPELIQDNYNGFLFEAGNINQLKEILANIIESPGLLENLRGNARRGIEAFEMSGYIQRLLSIYNEVSCR